MLWFYNPFSLTIKKLSFVSFYNCFDYIISLLSHLHCICFITHIRFLHGGPFSLTTNTWTQLEQAAFSWRSPMICFFLPLSWEGLEEVVPLCHFVPCLGPIPFSISTMSLYQSKWLFLTGMELQQQQVLEGQRARNARRRTSMYNIYKVSNYISY